MSRSLMYRNNNFSEDIQGCLLLLGSQIILSFFLVLFLITTFMGKYPVVDYIWVFIADGVLLLLTYFQIRGIKNALFYFLSSEKYTVEKGRLFYEKTLKLFKMEYRLRKFDILLNEIENISFLPPRKFMYVSNRWISPLWYAYYFKVHHRICIKLKSGNKYWLCNYVKAPNGLDIFADNSRNEERFMLLFQAFKDLIEKGKEDAIFQNRLKEWGRIYENSKNERYFDTLTQILKEEKVFFRKEENIFVVNAGEEAIHHLDMFKEREFEEMNFYKFYLDYLSHKEYENIVVRVADNGIDYKEVTMRQLKEEINKLRDEK